MRIHHLYTDDKGESHFADIEVAFDGSSTASSVTSKARPASGIIFRRTNVGQDTDWHTAPRRQYLINLDAGVEITASDGEARHIGAGEIILLEDTTGKGHLSKNLDGKIRHSVFIPID